MSFKRFQIVPGVASTVGLTTTTICSFDLSSNSSGTNFDNCAITAYGKLTGRETTTGAVASAQLALVSNRVSGSLTQIGTTQNILPILNSISLAGVAGVLDISGNILRLRATGIITTTIEWLGHLEIHIN